MRAACGDSEELPLEQMTLVSNDALLPSSADAGSIVRAQNARPIPSSDAHTSVAANGQVVRFRCDGDGKLAVVAADVWFALDTGQIPDEE